MKTFPDIHRRPIQNAYSPPKLKYQHQVEIPNAAPMVIPLPLLEVADQSNEAVAAYRTLHYPAMGPQEPRIPSPAGPPERSEAVESEHVRGEHMGRSSPSADSERTVSERREGDGQEGVLAESRRPTTRESRPVHRPRPHVRKIRVTHMPASIAVSTRPCTNPSQSTR